MGKKSWTTIDYKLEENHWNDDVKGRVLPWYTYKAN